MRTPAATLLTALAALAAFPALAAAKPAARAREPQGAVAEIRAQGRVEKVPLFSDRSRRAVIARVGGDPILLQDLVLILSEAHAEHGDAKGGKKDFRPVLDRMIATKLIAREAREMGMQDLEEVAGPRRQFAEGLLRDLVKREATKNVTFDRKEADELYRGQIREWKLRSILFHAEEDAKRARAEIEGGRKFEDVSARAVADKKAKSTEDTAWVSVDKVTGPVAQALAKLPEGAVTLPVKVPEGWAVIRVDGIRYPDNADARAWAEETSRDAQRQKALHRYLDVLAARFGKMDRALLAKLDYDAAGKAKGGFDALRSDRRPLVTIAGEAPVTVGDLTVELEKKFYHGAERAAGEKRVNADKQAVFESLAFRRLLLREAKRQKLAETPAFKRAVAEQEEAFLFGTYVQRAIVPEVKVQESDGQKRYDEHKDRYTYPRFLKLDGLGFREAKDAEAALAKLRKGTDLGWLRQNAAGQLPEADRALDLGGTVSERSLPEAVAKALAGAHAGDARVYAGPEGAYVLQIVSETPPRVQTYAEVREAILRELYAEAVEARLQEFLKKLRAATPVEVYLTALAG